MSLHVSSWHYGGSAVFIDVEEAYPVQASPAQVRNIASDDMSSMVWPYFPGDRQQRTVFIRDLADPRVVVVEPIPVSLEVSDGQPTACCYDLEQFGIGDDEFSALDDLRATIVELYLALKGEQSLGPLPQRQLAYLRSVVREA
ncbi:MAG: hypothetical protein HYY95_22365 [Candidatus Rokubacteria bacterium]|nr:hypothetical protein [Candidatus Rokubacteria bacterium]MBI3108285.1 hypothetical protein [Candidatus Rokubacteria bacterium]